MIKKFGRCMLCFFILLLLGTTAYAASDTFTYSFLGESSDYGLRGFGYRVKVSESYSTFGTTVNLNDHYIRIYAYDWQNPLGGSAGLWHEKYYAVSSSNTLLGTLQPSYYSYDHDIILPGNETTYFLGESSINFSHFNRYGSKVFVSTYFNLGSDWVPGIKTFEDELVIRY